MDIHCNDGRRGMTAAERVNVANAIAFITHSLSAEAPAMLCTICEVIADDEYGDTLDPYQAECVALADAIANALTPRDSAA